MRTTCRMMSAILSMALLLSSPTAQTSQTETPEPAAPEAVQPPRPEAHPLTLGQVTEMLRSGTRWQAVANQVRLSGSTFDLTIEDVVRLTRLGAGPGLIQQMTRSAQASVAEPESMTPAPEAAPTAGTLTYRKIMKMYHKGMPADRIADEIARNGLKEPIALDQLLELGAGDFPESLLLAMAAGARPVPAEAAGAESTPAAGGESDQPPLKTAEIRKMLEQKRQEAEIITAIRSRGVEAPPSLQEAIELRKLGATDPIVEAINNAALDLAEEPEEESIGPGEEAIGPATAFPQTADTETVTVLSHPEGARVYLSPARTRDDERFRNDYLVGKTPVSVTVPPGDYMLTVEKRAGPFEAGLLPAWRTMHDLPSARSVLDDTELTFDPRKCCLPGSVSGVAQLRPIREDQPRAIIGDQFDGLPPYLFDGETLQILRVRHTQITDVLKLYRLRKTSGQARALIALFIPAEGDPLDLGDDTAAIPGASFDSELRQLPLQYITSEEGQKGVAGALGIDAERLSQAIPVLRKFGKVILHQQVPSGVRLLSMAIDYNGRLRVTDQTILPEDPFAPPPAKKGKKKKAAPAPPPIPPLPALERIVVPGLGSPRLNVANPGPAPAALIFDDGEFCFAPGGATTECVIDPGTHQVNVMSGGEQRAGGTMHLSYHSRSTMKMPPMPVR